MPSNGLPLRRALAEFAVIVIGVLVALAVDDWRQSVADRALERHLLETMLVDIDESRDDLFEAANSAATRAFASAELLLAIGEDLPGPPPDPVDIQSLPTPIPVDRESRLQNILILAGYAQVFDLRRSAYDQMMSSGTLSIIRDPELRTEVVRHYTGMIDFQESNSFIRDDGQQLFEALYSVGLTHGDWLPDQELLERLGSTPRMRAVLRRTYIRAIEQRDGYPMIADRIAPFRQRIAEALEAL